LNDNHHTLAFLLERLNKEHNTFHHLITNMPAFHEPDEADVQTAIHYYAPHPGRSGPELNDLDLLLDMKQADSRRMPISNARGREDTFSIDRQGFEFIHLGDGKRFGSEMKAWDEMEVKQEYYPLVEEVYRKV
jgi:hypothetical protein